MAASDEDGRGLFPATRDDSAMTCSPRPTPASAAEPAPAAARCPAVLANPIFIGAWDDTLGIAAVVLALILECAVVARLLRDEHPVRWRPVLLGAINLLTWPVFVSWLPEAWNVIPPLPSCFLLEAAVVLVEGSLLWAVSRTPLRAHLVAARPLSWRRSVVATFVGNLASVAAGFVFLAIVLRPGGLLLAMTITALAMLALSEFVQFLPAPSVTARRAQRTMRRPHARR